MKISKKQLTMLIQALSDSLDLGIEVIFMLTHDERLDLLQEILEQQDSELEVMKISKKQLTMLIQALSDSLDLGIEVIFMLTHDERLDLLQEILEQQDSELEVMKISKKQLTMLIQALSDSLDLGIEVSFMLTHDERLDLLQEILEQQDSELEVIK